MRTIFNREEYDVAIEGWSMSCGSYSTIQNLIPTNYVFNLTADQLDWIKGKNQYNKFCVEMGVYDDQLIIILAPLDSNGQKIPMNEYSYATLSELETDLRLVETEQYVLVKNAVLSRLPTSP